MDVVSQLCFYDNTPPSDEVIDKLLKYIFYTSERCETVQHIKRTKEMTIFDTGLDPNPVFRSFLLQLLMRTRFELFVFYLDHSSEFLVVYSLARKLILNVVPFYQ